MIEQLQNVPANVAAFKVAAPINKEEYYDVMAPAVRSLTEGNNTLGLLVVLDGPVKEFSFGMWMMGAALDLKQLAEWQRVAIVTEPEMVQTVTGTVGKFVPNEFRGFAHTQLEEAINWTSAS